MPGYTVRQLFPEELEDMLVLTSTAYNSSVETFRRIYENDPFYSFELTRVAEEKGRLIAYMRAAPRTIWIGSSRIKMGGIAEVCTHPEHRRRGIASHLLREMVDLMAEREYPVSMLYGRSEFYGRLGWERCSIFHGIRAQIRNLPDFREGGKVREFSPDDLAAVMSLYDSTYRGRSCAMTRNRLHWEGRILPRTDLLVYEDDRKVKGYLAYARREEEADGHRRKVLAIHEAGYDSDEAIRGIVGCLARFEGCDSIYYPAPPGDRLMSALAVPGSNISAGWDGMFRVNDVKDSLETVASGFEGDVVLRIRDEIRGENSSSFAVSGSGDGVAVTRCGECARGLEIDIRDLSQLVPGTYSAGELASLGRIKASSREALRLAGKLFPRRHPFQPPVDHF